MLVPSKNLNTGKANRCWRRSVFPIVLKKFCYTAWMRNCMKKKMDKKIINPNIKDPLLISISKRLISGY